MSATLPSSTPSPKPENRLATRLFAFVVIVAGLALVGYVFLTAKQLFEAPSQPLPTPPPTPKPLPGATPAPDNNVAGAGALQAGWLFVGYIKRLLALLMMCIAGSIVAALGVRLWGKR